MARTGQDIADTEKLLVWFKRTFDLMRQHQRLSLRQAVVTAISTLLDGTTTPRIERAARNSLSSESQFKTAHHQEGKAKNATGAFALSDHTTFDLARKK
jgi:hypothetical protein